MTDIIQGDLPPTSHDGSDIPAPSELLALFQTMPQGVVYQDASGSITAANPAAEHLLGLTLDQMRGRTSADPLWRSVREDGTPLPASDHPSMVTLRTGRPVFDAIMGVFNPLWEGTRWLRVSATPEFMQGGTVPFQVYSIFEDVTEWHAERIARGRSEELRRAALAGAPIILWATDTKGVITLVEGSAVALLGQAPEEFVGRSVLDAHQAPSLRADWSRVMAGEDASYDTTRHGIIFHNEVTPQRGADGTVVGVIGVALDVTRQRQADMALRESHGRLEESEQRLRLALESGRLGSWELDLAGGEFRSVSPTFKALFGVKADTEFIRAESLRLIHPDDLPRVQEFIGTAVHTGETAVFEFRVRWPDGSEHWLQGHGQAVYDAEGHAVSLIGATQEITERKRAETNLRESAERQAVLVAAQQEVARTAPDLDATLKVVVRSAQKLTGADGARVEMVDGDQMVYRAASGSASAHIGLRLRRMNSLSGRCVVDGRPLLCEDSEDDPRVDREACRLVGVRSMAVVPLQYLGEAVGVLKVYSAAPRAFGEDALPLLGLMASMVVAAMSGVAEAEARRALSMSEERQRFALEGVGVGTWHWDIGSDRLTGSERCRELLGLGPDAVMTRDALYERIHPEDRLATRSATERAMAEDATYESEYRIVWDDGSVHWVAARGRGRRDGEGRTTHFEGTVQDIDATKAAAARQQRFLRDVLASVSEGHLRLCHEETELPAPLASVSGPITLTMGGGLRELRWAARDAGAAVGLPDERLHDLVTAVGEAAMNTVVHVGEGVGAVFADAEVGTVQVRIEDHGGGISLENLPHATLQKGFTTAGTMGHGMKMMLQQADRVFLLTGPFGTTVVVEQGRVAPPEAW